MQEILWDFEILTDNHNLARRRDIILIDKKERTCYFEDFAVPMENQRKWKVIKYLDLAKAEKLCKIMAKMIPIVVRALGIVPKATEKRLEKLKISGRIVTTQTSAQLKSTYIFRRVLEI